MLFVSNPFDRAVMLHAFDGSSVQIPPKTRNAQVADKFDWQPPKGILIKQGPPDAGDPTAIVPSPAPSDEVVKPPKDADEAKALQKTLGGESQ